LGLVIYSRAVAELISPSVPLRVGQGTLPEFIHFLYFEIDGQTLRAILGSAGLKALMLLFPRLFHAFSIATAFQIL